MKIPKTCKTGQKFFLPLFTICFKIEYNLACFTVINLTLTTNQHVFGDLAELTAARYWL